jgi:ATP-binding cassette subfamily C protein
VLYGAASLTALFVVKNLCLASLSCAETILTQTTIASTSNRLFRAYLYSPYTFHLQRNTAEIVRNLTEAAYHGVQFVESGIRLVREGLVLLVILFLMVLVDPLVSLSVFALLAVTSGGFYLIVRRTLTRRAQLSQDHWTRQVQVVNQSLGAIKDAKMLGRESSLIEMFTEEARAIRHHEIFYALISGLPRYFLEVLSAAAVFSVSAAFVLLHRPLDALLPIIALFGVAVIRLVPAVNGINVALVDLRYKRPAFELVCAELRALEAPASRTTHATGGQGHDRRMREGIRVEGVHYRYPDASAWALRGVSLDIKAGEAVALIGVSGGGKTTLIDVLLGLLTPTSGRVIADGEDIHVNVAAWQRQIGYITQDVYLIDDTIRRNIAFGLPDDAIDEVAIARALKAAQLDAFVRGLSRGAETLVGDRGVRLSGGQRQRIGIARALYHDPGILVMDEATSALDDETERDVMEAIEELRGDRTIIMVAHRMTTVRDCDRLYLLEEGRIKDHGRFQEMAARHANLRGRSFQQAADRGIA